MELKLEFTLRNEFVELKDLFLIFNNMVLKNEINSTDIKVKNYTKKNQTHYYLYIGLHRCKKNFASIEINRDIEIISAESALNITKFSDLKKSKVHYVPVFSIAEDNKTVTIVIYDTYAPKEIEIINNYDDILNIQSQHLLSLSFYLRKPFNKLSKLLAISNKMNSSSCFISLKPSIDGRNTYLNINFLFETLIRPSLSLTIGLIKNSIPSQYQFEIAKFNFVCLQSQTTPRFITCIETNDSKHGPIVKIDLFESMDSSVNEEIIRQFKLIDTISPLKM